MRYEDEIDVSGVEMRLVTDLIDKHGTTGATGIGPTLHSWSKHEMVKEELAFALEKIGQTSTATRTFEEVFFVDQDHREPAAFRS